MRSRAGLVNDVILASSQLVEGPACSRTDAGVLVHGGATALRELLASEAQHEAVNLAAAEAADERAEELVAASGLLNDAAQGAATQRAVDRAPQTFDDGGLDQAAAVFHRIVEATEARTPIHGPGRLVAGLCPAHFAVEEHFGARDDPRFVLDFDGLFGAAKAVREGDELVGAVDEWAIGEHEAPALHEEVAVGG